MLWLTSSELESWRLGSARDAWWCRVREAAAAHARQPAPVAAGPLLAHLDAATAAFVATAEVLFARQALADTAALMALQTPSDLTLAARAVHVAAALAFCREAWEAQGRMRVAGYLADLAHHLSGTDLGPSNPDNPFNNWWGVTHSGAALACLAVADEPFPSREAMAPSLDKMFAIERARVRTYLANYGEHGGYYEGVGYACYAMTHWAPLVLAERNRGHDLADLAPGIEQLGTLVAALTTARPAVPDEADGARPKAMGMRLHWNDDSSGAASPAAQALLMALAPPRDRPGLRWLYDHTCGADGDRSGLEPQGGLLWTLLFYPTDVAGSPEALPLQVFDRRTGTVVLRNRYRDADDCVFAAYAKSYHPGGHNHEDLGSWRFQGLGAGWAQGGGQAKAAAEFQCVITRDGRPNAGRNGLVSYCDPRTDGAGGSVSLRLGAAADCRVLDRNFAVDFTGRAGVPAVIGLLDIGSDPTAKSWLWSLCYERNLAFHPLPKENGFLLQSPAADGASLCVRFVAPAAVAIAAHEGPPSRRTFSNGETKHYPGARYVTVQAAGPDVRFFAVATLQRGAVPPLTVEGEGEHQDVVIGQARISLRRGRWFNAPLTVEMNEAPANESRDGFRDRSG